MDSSSDRTEDECSSQKSDSMDRSNGEKTCPHFLLSRAISSLFLPIWCAPSLFFSVSLSLSSSLSLPVSLSHFHSRSLRFSRERQKGRAPSCRIWYVRANSSIECVTQEHPLKGDKRPSRKSNSWDRSNANGPFPSLSKVEVSGAFAFCNVLFASISKSASCKRYFIYRYFRHLRGTRSRTVFR